MFTLELRQGMVATMSYIAMLAEHNVRKGFFELDQFQAIRKFQRPTSLRSQICLYSSSCLNKRPATAKSHVPYWAPWG